MKSVKAVEGKADEERRIGKVEGAHTEQYRLRLHSEN